ncbi:MAG TPA: VanZ family protein [Fimbriimonadaceae bacterium]|nr:VanZ family protein [Fimbriimonadaceae bacterium]
MLWRAVGLAAGFILTFAAIVVGSALDPSVWLVAALLVGVGAVLSLVPGLETLEARFLPMLGYAGVFGLGWLISLREIGVPTQAPSAQLLWLGFLASAIVGTSLLVLFRHVACRNAWLILALVLGYFVARFSGNAGGSGGSWEAWLVEVLGIGYGAAEWLVVAFRKGIHFMFYGIFAAAAYLAVARAEGLRVSQDSHPAQKQSAPVSALAFGFGLTIMHAIYDEARQTYAVQRTGSYWDIAIDALGALVFLWIMSRMYGPGQPIAQGKRASSFHRGQ